jgi:ABC-type sulfate/molybdate transport systems ATPase subunit
MSLTTSMKLTRGAFALELELVVEPGRTLALVGPNGAGKSTALGYIAGLVEGTGRVSVGGREIHMLPVEQRRIGYVFQDYLLFPHLSVRDNVAFGPRSLGQSRTQSRRIAAGWLDRLGLAHLADRRPAQLSGGQAQQVALARALATSPDVLLLDEPLAALDAELRPDVRSELAAHLADWGGITVVVTAVLAHDIVVLEAGRATQRGSLAELTAAPATPYVESFTADSALPT